MHATLACRDDPDPRKHVAETAGWRWKPLRQVDGPIRTAFVRWLFKLKPQEDTGEAMILSLGRATDVPSQQSASPRETVDSHDKGDLGEI